MPRCRLGASSHISEITTPVAQGVLGDDAHGEYASFLASNTPAMLQINILLLHGLHNTSYQVKMVAWEQQS
ncbi:hypothetical protein DV515_00009763 [Chloebia gouldiae]|uniref:Uncharacterized protein n=1 Tax=Chloebia gouldiae TaxID=44316 RepID=A0A3L8SB91_CHLGU|nr:hypothetical protein DV515_00009763 [Chloebia gouldiae]